MKEIRNKPASVLARLKNVAQANGIDYNAILILYMQERFLYRMSVSPYADNFVLKGGLLLFSIDHFNTRPTLDIDFLAINMSNRVDFMKQVISTIAKITCDDGLIFRTDDISMNIMEQNIYEGIRVGITCILGTARNRLRIDIGFGDVIVPKPADICYPVLLDTKPPPLIKGYSLESVIAEKFETMLKLSIINSRMKDYYDIYILSQRKRFEGRILQEAIEQTLQKRGTAYERNPLIFQERFINSIEKQREWNSYLGRIRSAPTISFREAVQQIIKFLVPVFESICNEEEFFFCWEPIIRRWQ